MVLLLHWRTLLTTCLAWWRTAGCSWSPGSGSWAHGHLDLHPFVHHLGSLVLDKLVGAVITQGTMGSIVEGKPSMHDVGVLEYVQYELRDLCCEVPVEDGINLPEGHLQHLVGHVGGLLD